MLNIAIQNAVVHFSHQCPNFSHFLQRREKQAEVEVPDFGNQNVHSLKGCVLTSNSTRSSDALRRRSSGKQFHNFESATQKQRSPKWLSVDLTKKFKIRVCLKLHCKNCLSLKKRYLKSAEAQAAERKTNI